MKQTGNCLPLGEVFGTTCWTLVFAAARGGGQGSIEAWQGLALRYWRPLYIYCRRKGDSPEAAQDHVQSFFESLLKRNRLEVLNPARGRFRNWLMAAIQQHRQRVWRHGQARMRWPEAGFDSRDVSEIEEALAACSPQSSAEEVFRREWAMTVLTRARRALRDSYVSRGLQDRYDHFWPRLVPGAGSDDHAALARALGLTPASLATALWQFRQDYKSTLRRIVRETMDEGDDLEAELLELLRAVSC